MLSKITSYGISGLEAYPVTIEVDVADGLPATIIVGLPDNAVKESKERVRAAIRNSGYKYNPRRITINLSPADTKKEGPSFDLAIALGVLAATEQIDASLIRNYVFLGELSLDGNIRSVNGALPVSSSVSVTQSKGLILPAANAREAALCRNTQVFPAKSLKEVIHFLKDPTTIAPLAMDTQEIFSKRNSSPLDFAEVKGQFLVKRGLEIAASGGHNVLMIGPPGSGKSMLAKRIPTILPDMTPEEALETTKIHSCMGLLKNQNGIMASRPFRSVHHTSSDVALIGGGSVPKPGEVTLSHNGVLFLDELPEFSRHVLEVLRQPLEDAQVTVSRAKKTLVFPAQFMLIGSMNPCPCGWYTDAKKECHCHPNQIRKYMSKISGPLLDRIDIHLEVPSLVSADLLKSVPSESSKDIKARTTQARTIQLKRFKGLNLFSNAQMSQAEVGRFCRLDSDVRDLLCRAVEELGFSARSHHRILKVARTIADLAGSESITCEHLSEAIQYRSLDRNW